MLRTFDPKTRRAFANWLDQQGRAIEPSGLQLNTALADLTPFAKDVDNLLVLLRRQDGATRGVVRNTGAVFEALSERRGQLRGLIRNANTVFATTASRDRKLADTFVAFPTFLREARATTCWTSCARQRVSSRPPFNRGACWRPTCARWCAAPARS